MQLTFDEQSRSYYLKIQESASISDTETHRNMTLDLDKYGKIIGIEILPFNIEELASKSVRNNIYA